MTRKAKARVEPSKNLFSEIFSILFLAAAVFVTASILTFDPQDPSIFTNAENKASNACGWVGAYLASIFLHSLGLGSFLLPAALLFMGATVYQREGFVRLLGLLSGMAVAVMSLSVLLTFQWKFFPYSGTLLLTGGAFGAWMAEALAGPLNPLGATIVSSVIFMLALVLATPVSVARTLAFFVREGARIVYRLGRLAGYYTLYGVSWAGTRAIKHTGDWVQIAWEENRRRRMERKKLALEAPETKLIEVDSEVEEDEVEIDEPEIDQPEVFADAEPETEPEFSTGETVPMSAASADPVQLELDGDDTELEEEYEAADEAEDDEYEEEEYEDDDESDEEGEEEVHEIDIAALKSETESEGNVPTILPKQIVEERKGVKTRRKVGNWKLPTIEFLQKPEISDSEVNRAKLIENSKILNQKLADFGIQGEVTAVRPGPVITLYEFKPGPGIKVSRIAALADDLSMALSAKSVRILAPLPGKSVVGIEIPSEQRERIYFREFFQKTDFFESKHQLPVIMGKDIGGQPVLSDLARMPHLLVAGQTGSGKSVFMNNMINSLLYRFTPDELRLILVDPKFIEFRSFQDLPHLLLPVVDDPKQASIALKWAVKEMERRYRILAMMGSRNLAGYNKKVDEMGIDVVRDVLASEEGNTSRLMSGADWREAYEKDDQGEPMIGKLPYICVVIDELADLMMVAKKDVEISIARIAQKARAAGIHMVIATQRPSTDVITGLIKANLPSRVSFQLASHIDSKTILDRAGAEKLLGEGDMLFVPPGTFQLQRLHGAFVADEEIEKICSFLRSQGEPTYREEILLDEEDEESGNVAEDQDELFVEAVALVKRSGHASASFLQRHLKIGYNRAARMIETMEERGIVGPADGARPREVLLR